MYLLVAGVVDRHRVDVDPDPNFHFGADMYPEWHQKDADPHADPTPNFCSYWKIGEKNLLLFTAMPAYNGFPFSSVARSRDFKYFGQHIEISITKKNHVLVTVNLYGISSNRSI
jgi:hypothetical protein